MSSRGRGRVVGLSSGKQYDEHSMKTGCLRVCSLEIFHKMREIVAELQHRLYILSTLLSNRLSTERDCTF